MGGRKEIPSWVALVIKWFWAVVRAVGFYLHGAWILGEELCYEDVRGHVIF